MFTPDSGQTVTWHLSLGVGLDRRGGLCPGLCLARPQLSPFPREEADWDPGQRQAQCSVKLVLSPANPSYSSGVPEVTQDVPAVPRPGTKLRQGWGFLKWAGGGGGEQEQLHLKGIRGAASIRNIQKTAAT